MTGGTPGESISDYSGFDFRALWKRREKVTEVERAILRRALSSGDCRRILEVGTGFGRLLETLTQLGPEVVATDFDVGSLGRLAQGGEAVRPTFIAANVYHLPFVAASFSGATMIRVYHHLSEPALALAELARVLRGGSRFLVSYNPKPSLGTIVNDIQRALAGSRRVPYRSITFQRGPVVLPPDPFPVYVAGRADFERTARSAGFSGQVVAASGLEEYYFMRHIPTELFVRLGTALGRAPAFSMRFVVLTKPGRSGGRWPEAPDILACPRCRTPMPGWAQRERLECDRCPYVGERRNGVLDLRYIPSGVPRWGTAA